MSNKGKIYPSCDLVKSSSKELSKTKFKNKNKLYRFKGDFSWKGVKTEKYKSNQKGWSRIVRKTLIGNRGETSKFHLRYFEIAPGGYSSYEFHKHEHVVIGIRGRGICSIKKRNYNIGYLDIIYIKPSVPHQLKNPYQEPFGFFCIVNARRDKPKIIY